MTVFTSAEAKERRDWVVDNLFGVAVLEEKFLQVFSVADIQP